MDVAIGIYSSGDSFIQILFNLYDEKLMGEESWKEMVIFLYRHKVVSFFDIVKLDIILKNFGYVAIFIPSITASSSFVNLNPWVVDVAIDIHASGYSPTEALFNLYQQGCIPLTPWKDMVISLNESNIVTDHEITDLNKILKGLELLTELERRPFSRGRVVPSYQFRL